MAREQACVIRRRLGLSLLLLLAAGCALAAAHERHRWPRILLPLWVRTVENVSYGPDPENRLDILVPRWTADSHRPAVVVFHGGAWAEGSREEMVSSVCRRYLQRGFLVANVEYRKGAITPAVEDAVLALEWFCRNAAFYGADRSRIVVTGESAGAHLALMAAFRSGEPTAAVVNFYGPADLAPLLDRPEIRAVLPLSDREAAATALSPVTYVRRGLPPVFSIHGAADSLIPPGQTATLTRALREAGGEAFEFYIPGGGHGFSEAQQETAYQHVFEFLKRFGILRLY